MKLCFGLEHVHIEWHCLSKIYDKRGDFNFKRVIFPFLNGDDPRSSPYGVYISQLIRFARMCSGYRKVTDWRKRWVAQHNIHVEKSLLIGQ